MNNKFYTIPFTILLILLLLLAFLIWYLFKNIQDNSRDFISIKNSIATLNAQAKQTAVFGANYKNYASEFSRIDGLFVDMGNPVDFIEFLENVSADTQLISKVSLPVSQKQANQSLSVSAFGIFSNILDFVKQIEEGPYLVEIESLTIKNSQTSQASARVENNTDAGYFSRKVNASIIIKIFAKS